MQFILNTGTTSHYLIGLRKLQEVNNYFSALSRKLKVLSHQKNATIAMRMVCFPS